MRTVSLCLFALIGTFALACGSNSPGDGGGSGIVQPTAAYARKLSGIGDSIMEAFDAKCPSALPCLEQPQLSFAQGTDSSVDSLFKRYQAVSGLAGGEQFVSKSGATMIGLVPALGNAMGQADAICAQSDRPNRIVILMGANDICHASSVGALPTVAQFQSAVAATLERLAAEDCGLPAGTWVHVLSVPRIDLLREAGLALNASVCQFAWRTFGICPAVTQAPDQSTLDAVHASIDAYNEALAAAVNVADQSHGGLAGIHFTTDWRGTTANTSVGTFAFGAGDVSSTDCFHPSVAGQRKLACAAWETWEGGGDASCCL
jgi:hypothetical protein